MYTLQSRAIKKAASSNMTDEDISNVLDKEDESDVFSEEFDDFLFDTSEEDSDSEPDTSNVVHKSEPYEELSNFLHPFVPHGVVRTRFAFLGVSGMNVVSGMFSEIY
jgi:hypothetical protein